MINGIKLNVFAVGRLREDISKAVDRLANEDSVLKAINSGKNVYARVSYSKGYVEAVTSPRRNGEALAREDHVFDPVNITTMPIPPWCYSYGGDIRTDFVYANDIVNVIRTWEENVQC